MSIQLDTQPDTGRIVLHFVLPVADHPDPVSVVGNFNDWTPGTDLLIDHGDGTIGVNVPVDLGTVIHFRYLASNGRWFDDPDAEHVTADGAVFQVPEHVPADADPTTAEDAGSIAAEDAAFPLTPASSVADELEPTGQSQGKGRKR